jgi:microcystin-dependent protein
MGIVQPIVVASVQTGSIIPFGSGVVPTGYLLCDGQAVSRAAYADLFNAIGVTWGAGDGATTFNVPDMRGRTPVGRDNMGGVAANRIAAATPRGATGGAATHQLVAGEMPLHTHVQNAHGHSHTHGSHSHVERMTNGGSGTAMPAAGAGTLGTEVSSGITTDPTTPSADATSATPTNQDAGGNGAHNNVQPYGTTDYIIKT